MIGREARGQHIIDLGWRALEVFSQFVAAKFNRLLLILFILHQSLDKSSIQSLSSLMRKHLAV